MRCVGCTSALGALLLEQIIARMRANEDLKTIATDTAYVSGVTPGQVLLYIHALLKVAQSPPKQ